MRDTFLPFSPPAIGEAEIAEVISTLRTDWITTGPKVKLFEAAFASFVEREDAVAFNSWTAAAHTALVCLGVGPGDEVIVPTFTFAATANIVEHCGAKPIFVDVEQDTLNLDPDLVEAAITSRTKVIVPVHFGGHPADMTRIEEIAKKHNLYILEDAAHALPSYFETRIIGSRNIVAFSFYATKNLATAEGGMLVGPADLLEKARIVGLHGMSRAAWNRYGKGGSWKYDIETPGFKYNMTDIAASLGLHQLSRLQEFQSRRDEIAALYSQSLKAIPGIKLPSVRNNVRTCWHLFPVRVEESTFGMSRDELIVKLGDRNIGTSVHFIPVHMFSYYANKYDLDDKMFPVATRVFSEILSLPMSPKHSNQDIADVIKEIDDLFAGSRSPS
jgi:dTDP-4-amino-4,6-dideoxygalactose transaminase